MVNSIAVIIFRCKKARCNDDILILHHRAVTALSINPMTPHELAIGSSDSTVRTFDRRMLGTVTTGYTKKPVHDPLCSFTVPELEERTYRITSLSYSPDGQEMLVSYSSDHLYLFRVRDQNERDINLAREAKKLKTSTKRVRRSPPPVRRLRLRGDWSDTGPDARPERDTTNTVSIGQARPQLQATLMERMTNVLFRMLNDPLTRAALSAGGEDSLETNSSSTHSQENPPESAAQPEEPAEQEIPPENQEQVEEIEVDPPENIEQPPPEDPSPSASDHKPSGSKKVHGELNHLHNELSTLRHGFIEKHGSEPSVSLRYSDQSSSNSTIRLGVGDELNRSNYNLEGSSSSAEPDPERNSSLEEAVNSSNQAEIASTSCDNNFRRQNENEDNEMDLSSNDELMPEAPYRSKSRADFDVELEYSDSDDDSREMLKNKLADELDEEEDKYVFEPHVKQKYVGHRNARTMIKESTFWGNDYVMSGSDCGHVFVWDRFTAKLVMLLQADHHVVNCLQPHPTLPLLATSGIDHDVKLWAPILEEANFDSKMADDLMKRNEVMLEETRDTITVPAAFMIRMLACLNQIRRTGSLSTRSRRRDESEPDA